MNFFFKFVSAVGDEAGLSLKTIAKEEKCSLDEANLFRVQMNLVNMCMDKMRNMSDASVDVVLASIPVKLWQPSLARQDSLRVLA